MKKQPQVVSPGTRIELKDFDPAYTGQYRDKLDAREDLRKHLERMAELQELLYAERKHALLIILQGTDASGKDGTIRHVMNAFNPQGCRVVAFKVPTPEEYAHDFLWRVHKVVPQLGEAVIFNRSHYEDVVAARVEKIVSKEVWKARYAHINHFEQLLADSGTTILKFFLHLSFEEQKRRLEERYNDPTKHWKFSLQDLDKRKRWDDYQKAYEDMLNECSTEWAPWYIVPADRKWYRNLLISEVVVNALEKMNMRWPALAPEARDIHIV